jgi:predicted dithiol-disulfide oxidoreductase (DUF899 family)
MPVHRKTPARRGQDRSGRKTSSTQFCSLTRNGYCDDNPRIVTPQEWQDEWQRLLVKEKQMTRAHDALAAERRRMPWVSVDRQYTFEGPEGTMSLLDLFSGRRQLIIDRAFFDPGVHGQPEGTAGVERGRACVGCSMFADHVGNLAHLNARDTTLVFASRASQPDIARLKGADGLENAVVHHHR